MHPRRVVMGALVGVAGAVSLRAKAAPATVEEQRSRLPPPAQCVDPVEGVWMSHRYEPPFDEWMVFTLTIRRQGGRGGNELSGTIQAHAWFGGGPGASEPPRCTGTISDWIVGMHALGRVNGPRIEFWGTDWQVQQVFCGPRGFGYNLDHFSGEINPTLLEFQSVNNDGGHAVNDPTVFRRVRCLDADTTPHPFVAAPPFAPPPSAWRCDR